QPAVTDDAVLLGRCSGEDGGLGGAGDGGQHLAQRTDPALAGERAEPGGMREQTGGEADGVDEDGGGWHEADSLPEQARTRCRESYGSPGKLAEPRLVPFR